MMVSPSAMNDVYGLLFINSRLTVLPLVTIINLYEIVIGILMSHEVYQDLNPI